MCFGCYLRDFEYYFNTLHRGDMCGYLGTSWPVMTISGSIFHPLLIMLSINGLCFLFFCLYYHHVFYHYSMWILWIVLLGSRSILSAVGIGMVVLSHIGGHVWIWHCSDIFASSTCKVLAMGGLCFLVGYCYMCLHSWEHNILIFLMPLLVFLIPILPYYVFWF